MTTTLTSPPPLGTCHSDRRPVLARAALGCLVLLAWPSAVLGGVEDREAQAPSVETTDNGDTTDNNDAVAAPLEQSPVEVIGGGPPATPSPLRWSLSAWLQSTYRLSRLSENELLPDGRPRNQDGFFLDRAQIDGRVVHGPTAMRAAIELTTLGSVAVVPRRAYATYSLVLLDEDDRDELGIHVSVGQQSIPFGLEVRRGHRERWFADRSLGSSALFPGLTDVGIRAHGGAGPFRVELGAFQGEPVTVSSQWRGRSPTRTAELVGRTAFVIVDSHGTLATLGLSALHGTGFHPGRPASADAVGWLDFNENGVLDAGELIGVPGRAAQASQTFERWAFGGDFAAVHDSPYGRFALEGEVTIAQNLDRGLLISDPVAAGIDLRQLSWFAAARYHAPGGLLGGVRYDYYNPHGDFLDDRRGARFRTDAAQRTTTLLVGWSANPSLRVTAEVSLTRDLLGRDVRGEPRDLDNNQGALRLHAEF